MELKNRYLKSSAPLSKVIFDGKISVIKDALGLHTYVSRVQAASSRPRTDPYRRPVQGRPIPPFSR